MIEPDEIIRSERRTLAVQIDPFGRLLVRAPKRCSTERIFAFLQQKEGWITRKRAEIQGAGICLPSENLEGYPLLLLGKKHVVRLWDESLIHVERSGETALLFLPRKQTKTRLIAWLKENALRLFSACTEDTAQKMGVTYKAVKINAARGSWGLCTRENEIRYSFRLLFCPKEVVEYVVLHELAHVRVKNHSPRFWAEVARYDAQYAEKRRWLKTHAALMRLF